MEEILSQIWDVLGEVFGGFGRAVERSLTGLFGSSNARYLRRLQPQVRRSTTWSRSTRR